MIQTHSDCKQHISVSLTDYETVAETMNQDVGQILTLITIAAAAIKYAAGTLPPWQATWIGTWNEWNTKVHKYNPDNLSAIAIPSNYMVWAKPGSRGFRPIPAGYMPAKLWFSPNAILNDRKFKPRQVTPKTANDNFWEFMKNIATKAGWSSYRNAYNMFNCRVGLECNAGCYGLCLNNFVTQEPNRPLFCIHLALPPGVSLPPPEWEPPNGNGNGVVTAGIFGDLLNLIKKFWYIPAGMLAITGGMLMFPRGRKIVLPKDWYDKIEPRRHGIKGGL